MVMYCFFMAVRVEPQTLKSCGLALSTHRKIRLSGYREEVGLESCSSRSNHRPQFMLSNCKSGGLHLVISRDDAVECIGGGCHVLLCLLFLQRAGSASTCEITARRVRASILIHGVISPSY